MNKDIDQLFKNFTNNEDKESLFEIFRNTPLTVETYNRVCSHLPICDFMGQWLLEGIGERLWEKAQNFEEWKLWGGPKLSVRHGSLDIDAVLAGSDGSGRWFDYFAYRWDETKDLFVDTLDVKGQSNRQVFFETAWYYAIITENITVLNKMFGSQPWCTCLCNPNPIEWFYFPLCFERCSPEVVNLLVQSQRLPFETILCKQLQTGSRNDTLQVLLNNSQATPEFVAKKYLEHWDARYYHNTDFSITLNEFIAPCVTEHDLDLFHTMIVEKCFVNNRRDLPNRNPELFVEHLKNTPLLNDVKFVSAMLARIDQLSPRASWPQILEIFVDSLSPSEWDIIVNHHPNNEFLQRLPRGQKHILLQQIDLQNKNLGRRKI